jgi:DNA-directed RNA polymerase specialized sigma24 family protein
MARLQIPHLLDERGQPFNPELEQRLRRLIPRLRKTFRTLNDDQEVTEILEEAGRRIRQRQQGSEPLEEPQGFAWVTVKNVAKSRLGLDASRLRRETLRPEASDVLLSRAEATIGSQKRIEQSIEVQELFRRLSPQQRLVCNRKMIGRSSEEIAYERGSSKAAVDMIFSRAKRKLRRLRNATPRPSSHRRPRTVGRTDTERVPLGAVRLESPHGEQAPET